MGSTESTRRSNQTEEKEKQSPPENSSSGGGASMGAATAVAIAAAGTYDFKLRKQRKSKQTMGSTESTGRSNQTDQEEKQSPPENSSSGGGASMGAATAVAIAAAGTNDFKLRKQRKSKQTMGSTESTGLIRRRRRRKRSNQTDQEEEEKQSPPENSSSGGGASMGTATAVAIAAAGTNYFKLRKQRKSKQTMGSTESTGLIRRRRRRKRQSPPENSSSGGGASMGTATAVAIAAAGTNDFKLRKQRKSKQTMGSTESTGRSNQTDQEEDQIRLIMGAAIAAAIAAALGISRMIWSPPPAGRLKMNTDAICKGTKQSDGVQRGPSWFAGILRNHRGKWVRGFLGFIDDNIESLVAEIYSINGGLELLDKDGQYSGSFLENDNKGAVNWINGKYDNKRPRPQVIKDCWKIIVKSRQLARKNNITIGHVVREANECADRLADMAAMAVYRRKKYLIIKNRPHQDDEFERRYKQDLSLVI